MRFDDILDLIEDYHLSRQGDYENAESAAKIVDLLAHFFTDDTVINILDNTKAELLEWIDNYDPTPWIAPTKQ